MRELGTRKRTHGGSRVRSVQGRLSIEIRNEDETGAEPAKVEPSVKSSGFRRPPKSSGPNPEKASTGTRPPAPAFHPLAYRSVVADWPIAWREEWGRRANELEESGVPWRDAETQAFVEFWHKLQREGRVAPSPEAEATSSGMDAPSLPLEEPSDVNPDASPPDQKPSPAE